MDSRQLLTALVEAQHQAGGRPVKVRIHRDIEECSTGEIKVHFEAAPEGIAEGELLKPEIVITHNA